MGIIQSDGYLMDDGTDRGSGQGLVLHPMQQRPALDIAHDDITVPFGLTVIVDGEDVRMFQPGDDLCFPFEPLSSSSSSNRHESDGDV